MMCTVDGGISGDVSHLDHPIRTVSIAELYRNGYEDCDRRMSQLDIASALLGWEPKIPGSKRIGKRFRFIMACRVFPELPKLPVP